MLLVISLLKAGNEIIQFGILPRMFLEVNMETSLQSLLAENAVDLFKVGCTFSIGDTIED